MRSDARFAFLRERLLAAGVAPKRVRRYMTELSEHLDDLIRQQQALGYDGEDAQLRSRALLGSDDELAQGWLTDPRLKSFTARAPWAVIPAVTVAALVLSFALPVAVWLSIEYAGGWGAHRDAVAPAWFVQFSEMLSVSVNFMMPPLVALALALVAHRQRLNPAWASVPMIILLPLVFQVSVAPHTLSVGAGFRLPTGMTAPLTEGGTRSTAGIVLQIALTFAPALWLVLDRYRRRKQTRPHAV